MDQSPERLRRPILKACSSPDSTSRRRVRGERPEGVSDDTEANRRRAAVHLGGEGGLGGAGVALVRAAPAVEVLGADRADAGAAGHTASVTRFTGNGQRPSALRREHRPHASGRRDWPVNMGAVGDEVDGVRRASASTVKSSAREADGPPVEPGPACSS